MAGTGLHLCSVPTALVQSSGRPVSDADKLAGLMSLCRWQPDFVVISYTCHKIAILDLSRPSDVWLERIQAAHQAKLDTYQPLCRALCDYTNSGWDVRVLPWIVGARGLVRKRDLCNALEFLEVPLERWQTIIEDTIRASITALAFMHRTRFSVGAPGLAPDITFADALPRRGTKRMGPDKAGDFAAVIERWKRMAASAQKY